MTTQPQREPLRGELHPAQRLAAEPDVPPSTTETVRGGRRLDTQPQRIHHLLDRARRGVILPAEGEALAELVGHLVAAQCTDQLAVCNAHHLPPVAGCPYPRCRAARATGRAATA